MAKYFISYNSQDEQWARWIANTLEAQGHETVYQAADFRAGDQFVEEIHEALTGCDAVVGVLSSAYLGSDWCMREWATALVDVVEGRRGHFVPFRVGKVNPTGILRGHVYVDLVGLSEQEARSKIEAALKEGRDVRQVAFPGAAASIACPTYQVPDPTNHFVGREDKLDELRDHLSQTDAKVRLTSVEAAAGIGKTELAIQAAHVFANEGLFPGGIFWLNAEEQDLGPQWGGAIADDLDVGGESSEDRSRRVLARIKADRRASLVILDNVSSWGADAQPRPVPSGSQVKVLATTRLRDLHTSFHAIELGVLSDDQALELMESFTGGGYMNRSGASDLLEHLDGHALGIELAGAYMRASPEVTPEEYMKLLEEAEPGIRVGSQRYEWNVTQALELTWNRLDEDTRTAWTHGAQCAPESVRVEFSDAVGVGRELRRALSKHRVVDAGKNGVWRMHRLVAQFGRRRGGSEATESVVASLSSLVAGVRLGTGHSIVLPDRAHFLFVVGLGEGLSERPEELSRLMDRIATGLHSAGDFGAAKELMERALDADLQNHGAHSSVVATRRSNLATIEQALGNLPRAKELTELALRSDLETCGEAHPDVATDRSILAQIEKALGNLPRAKELAELALRSALETYGEAHPEVATLRSNLALIEQALGNLPRAKELTELALHSGLETYGEAHPKVAIRRSNLATIEKALGNLPRAKELTELALCADLETYGEAHPEVAIRRSNLATIEKALGNLPQAKELAELALRSALETYGEAHPVVATLRSNLALIEQALGNLPRAKELSSSAVAVFSALFEEGHRSLKAARSVLDSIERQMKGGEEEGAGES